MRDLQLEKVQFTFEKESVPQEKSRKGKRKPRLVGIKIHFNNWMIWSPKS